jgi:hypothetical protein
MVKKAFLAVCGLALVLVFATPQKASAQVSIGVAIGTPVYVHPVRPYVYPARWWFRGPTFIREPMCTPRWHTDATIAGHIGGMSALSAANTRSIAGTTVAGKSEWLCRVVSGRS